MVTFFLKKNEKKQTNKKQKQNKTNKKNNLYFLQKMESTVFI